MQTRENNANVASGSAGKFSVDPIEVNPPSIPTVYENSPMRAEYENVDPRNKVDTMRKWEAETRMIQGQYTQVTRN